MILIISSISSRLFIVQPTHDLKTVPSFRAAYHYRHKKVENFIKDLILTFEMDEKSENNVKMTLEDMNRILEISKALAATGDRDELLSRIIDFSLDLLDVERGTLFLYDEKNHELVARIATGVEEIRVPADKGFCGECIKTGRTILIPDAYADERFNPEVDRKTGFVTRNIMSVPLNGYDNRLVGVLQVLNRKDGEFADYDVMLAEMLAAQAGVVIQKANLIEHLLQKQEMERAMQIARDIQQTLLPKTAPKIPGFDVAGLTDPADETGGDFFDYIHLPDGRWAFAVADATGHGIGPALVMSETRAILRACAMLEEACDISVCGIIGTANRMLCEDLDGASFVTCFLGILDPAENTLTYISAGHGPLLFYAALSDSFQEVAASGLPLGIMNDASLEKPTVFRFKPGNMAIITTDGLFEARNSEKEQFGIERVTEHFRMTTLRPSLSRRPDPRSKVPGLSTHISSALILFTDKEGDGSPQGG